MMASKNVRPNITKHDQAVHWLRVLSSELAVRLQEGRERAPSLWPKTLVLHVRQASEAPRSRQIPFPFSKSINAELISKPAEKLWKELIGTSTYKVHNLALGFSGLGSLESGQQGIEGFFSNRQTVQGDSEQSKINRGTGAKRKRDEDDGENQVAEDVDQGSSTSFICQRCKKNIALPTEDFEREDGVRALDLLKMEHQDFHFAQDLSREVVAEDDEQPERRKVAKKRKKNGQPKGIAQYFSAKPKK
ncbi:DNA-directed DNA polymerase eta rad30 [Tulasnella sp. 419]|nr:DNA-directed DNA polymerase eta rad30 [Tulasnella sp. 419]